MLNSDYQAFLDIIDMLQYEVATFLPNLVKIGPRIFERHQFFEIQDGGNRHVGFRLPGNSQYHRMCCYSFSLQSYQIWWKLVKNWLNGIHFSQSKMAAGAILKFLLPAEPPSFELYFECISLNQKCCVSWSVSMYKGSYYLVAGSNEYFLSANWIDFAWDSFTTSQVIFTDKGLLQIRANIFFYR